MPASRAVCSGSPFLTRPLRTSRRASADIRIDPRAIASRAVTGLSPTSTILTRPRASTCDNLFAIVFPLRKEKRQAFERHRQIDALQFHSGGNLQMAGREIQDGFDAGGDDEAEDVLRGGGGHGDDRDSDAFALDDLF